MGAYSLSKLQSTLLAPPWGLLFCGHQCRDLEHPQNPAHEWFLSWGHFPGVEEQQQCQTALWRLPRFSRLPSQSSSGEFLSQQEGSCRSCAL